MLRWSLVLVLIAATLIVFPTMREDARVGIDTEEMEKARESAFGVPRQMFVADPADAVRICINSFLAFGKMARPPLSIDTHIGRQRAAVQWGRGIDYGTIRKRIVIAVFDQKHCDASCKNVPDILPCEAFVLLVNSSLLLVLITSSCLFRASFSKRQRCVVKWPSPLQLTEGCVGVATTSSPT